MTARPTPTTPFQEETYGQLGAWSEADAGDWDLLQYVGAIASMFDQIEGYARDQSDGTPGWAILLDPDNCPSEALGYLGQFVGVSLLLGLSDSAQRDRIKSTDGFKRGSPGAIIGAAQQFLTGTKTVYLNERSGGAYNLSVATLVSETPDSAAVLKAITDQKPAGLILTYGTIAGGDYNTLKLTHTNYADVNAPVTTYGAVRINPSL